jgi:tetratricopeptide (TPR) repeat protein
LEFVFLLEFFLLSLSPASLEKAVHAPPNSLSPLFITASVYFPSLTRALHRNFYTGSHSSTKFQHMNTLPALRCKLVWLPTLLSFAASAQITTPRTPSPSATVTQTIGISKITVNYSRPSVKGREVWGNLVPFGWNAQGFGTGNSAPWRAGANENTTISFSHPATFEGKQVPPGVYGLFFVINQDNSGEVILSKDARSWGSFFYDQANDLLRSPIQVRSAPMTELLTYDFLNPTKTTVELVLNWEKKQFPVKIEFAVDDIVMANATEELKGPIGFNWQGFSTAANYALQNKVNYDQALKWIDQAIAQHNAFPTLNIKANLLNAVGKTEESNKMLTDAIAIATEVELNAYGYQLLTTGQVDKAIEIFMLNTKRHPKSANAWDSLGEGFATKGDKKNAVTNFKKSLGLNPLPNVKANSEKFLKQFGEL